MTGSVGHRFFEHGRAGSHLDGNVSFSRRFSWKRRIDAADFLHEVAHDRIIDVLRSKTLFIDRS